jgi:polyhydroxybutyrate depolymerase
MSLRPHCAALLCLVAAGCTRSNLDAILGAKDDGGSVNDASHINDVNDANDADSGNDSSSGTVSCPSPTLKAGDSTVTIQMGSTSRSYVLHVPAKYDGGKPSPLIVDFHAQNGSGSNQRTISPYPAQTDPEGVIMAFPSGLKGPGGAAWNVGPCCVADVDDVAFAKALVQEVKKVACIDANRVYAVGLATGGGMAYHLACHAADVFAAVAPAAFDLLEENVDECKPSRSITVISFRGTADPLVPYDGGLSNVVLGMPITFLGAQKTFKKWAEIDQCTDSPSAEDSNGCSSYSACQGGVEVILCTKQGGGLEAGNASVAWPVLRRHTR